MNKNLVIVIVIALVGLLGFSLLRKNSTSVVTPDSMMQEEKVSGTLLDLIALGKSYQCTFDTTDEEGNVTNGQVFVADKGDRMHGDFTVNMADGTSLQSYIMRDGQYNYIWSNDQTDGFKVAIDPEDGSLFMDSEEGEDNVVDDEANYDFDCARWVVNESMFVPPTDINFVDFSAQMEELNANMEGTPQLDCSVCDQIPSGESRDQCLSSLGC